MKIDIIRFMYKMFLNALPTLLFLGAFAIYGYLLLNGYDVGTERAKKYAYIYFNVGIYGSVITIVVFAFAEYYKLKYPELEEENIAHAKTFKSSNENTENEKNDILAKKDNESKFCKWMLNLLLGYTVAWVMELPYTYDDLYIALVAIWGFCWWKNKKKADQ